jgi:hypothetical protein
VSAGRGRRLATHGYPLAMSPAGARPRSVASVDHGVPPRMVRLRAGGTTLAIILGTAVLVIGPGLVMRAHPQWQGLVVVPFFGAVVSSLLPMTCQESGVPRVRRTHGDLLLTARTRTGHRTVNLSHLRSVRYVFLPGKPRDALDFVIITDVNGVRMGLTSDYTRRVVAEVLSTPDGRAGVSVSRSAAEKLRLAPVDVGWRWALRWYGTLALMTAWVLFVIGISAAIMAA